MAGYPGNKVEWRVPSGFSAVVDLFSGGGGWLYSAWLSNPTAKLYGAEANPLQRAILKGDRRDEVQQRAIDIAALLKSCIHPNWNGQGTYADLYPDCREKLGILWKEYVKEPFDLAYSTGEVSVEALAAQIVISTYGYGNNIRTSSKGLNVSPNAQKVKDQTPILNPLAPAQIYSDYREVPIPPGEKTIVLCDPPYWLPSRMRSTHKLLTSCYPGHDPYGQKTLDFYLNSLARVQEAGIKNAIVAGYYSEELDEHIRSSFPGLYVSAVDHGACDKQAHKHRFKHGKRSQKEDKPKPSEFEWIVSPVKLMQARQLTLLEV